MAESRGTAAARWAVPVLVGLVALALGGSLSGDFVWDDRPLIVENPLVKNADRLGELMTRGFWESDDGHDRFRAFFRPFVSLSFAIDHAIWGLRPFGFHLTNLLLHLTCTLLVWRIALRESVGPPAALAGAALFAVHPVHVESVAWISGRTDLLATGFALASFLAFRRGTPRVAALLFAAALFSKEAAAPLPLMVFAYAWFDARPGRRLAAAARAAAPFAAVLAAYAVVRVAAIGPGADPLYVLSLSEWLATALFVAARYTTLLVLPLGLDAHYPYAPLATPFDPRAALGLLMVGILAWSARRLARDAPRAAMWIVWAALALTPVFTFGHFGDVLLADRFLYLPSVGIALLAAHGVAAIARLPALRLRRTLVAATAGATALLVLLSAARVPSWSSDERLFGEMLETSPDSALVQNNLGMALYRRGAFEQAQRHFRRAVELAPGYAMAHNNLAAVLHLEGDVESALAHYAVALESAPGLMMAGANRGHLLVASGRVGEGLKQLRRTVDRHPRSPQALYALADGLQLAGRPGESTAVVERLAEVDADFPGTFYLRGKLLAGQGRLDEAADQMRRFLDLGEVEGRRAERAREIISRAASRATL